MARRYVEMRLESDKRRRRRKLARPLRPCGCRVDLTPDLLRALACRCVRCGGAPGVWVAAGAGPAVLLVPGCAAHELDAVAVAAAVGDVGADTFTMHGLDEVRRLLQAFHAEGGCRQRHLVIGEPDRRRRMGQDPHRP